MSLVVVDIQPEYQSYIPFLREFVAYINKTKQPITFLYNGHDTLGMVTESDYIWWLIENGVKESVIDNATFYDKGYAFFRYCMDEGVDHDEIVGLVKFMYDSGVNDTRDLDVAFWDEYIAQNGSNDLRELMEFSGDCINIPDLMDFLNPYNNVTLCGGGINECLKEVEIALDALGKKYKTLTQYVYEKGGKMLKHGGISDFDYDTLGDDTFAYKLMDGQNAFGADAQEYINKIENKRFILSNEKEITFTKKTQETQSHKPKGLWYGIELGWLEWVSSEMPHLARTYKHLHEIKVTDKVLKLNTISDALSFTEKYSVNKGYHVTINWQAVGENYSGIEVKDPYVWCRTKKGEDNLFWLYGWDVPSGCIWKADGIESITLIKSHDDFKDGGKLKEFKYEIGGL